MPTVRMPGKVVRVSDLCLAHVFFGIRPIVVQVRVGRYKCLGMTAFLCVGLTRAEVPQQHVHRLSSPCTTTPAYTSESACAVRYE